MNFKRTFFSNISTFALYNYATVGIEFLATIILSRLLLPEEYGFVAMINIFVGFIRLFSTIGIGASVIRSNYGYTYHKHIASLGIWLGITLFIILSGLSYPIALFFNNMKLILPTIVISVKFIFDSFTYIPMALMSKNLKFNILGKGKLLAVVTQVLFMIIFAALGFSYWSLIIPMIFEPIVMYIYLKRHVKLPLRLYSWKAAKSMIYRIRSLMGNLSMSNFVGYWSANADKVVIGRLYLQSDLGLYNRAFRFLQLSTRLITGIFNYVLFPSLKKLMDVGGNTQKEFMDIIRIITLFNLPLVFVLVVFPQELVVLLWGSDWTGVAPYLPYVAIIIVFVSVLKSTSSVFILYGKEYNLFLATLAKSLMNILLVIIGGLISIMHIVKLLTLGYILFTIPVYIYLGFYKSFRFNLKKTFQFWLPTIVFGLALFVGVHIDSLAIKIISFTCYVVILIYELKHTVYESIKMFWGFAGKLFNLNLFSRKNGKDNLQLNGKYDPNKKN
jgi:PST family polysaccharide transporter